MDTDQTQRRKLQQGDSVADCRKGEALTKVRHHGVIASVHEKLIGTLEEDLIGIVWPHDPEFVELVAASQVKWHHGAELWYVPRLPQQQDLIVSASDPSCIGILYYDLDDEIGVLWADNIQSLARLVAAKDEQFDKHVEEHDDEPSARDLGLALVERDKLSWNDFGYWVIVD